MGKKGDPVCHFIKHAWHLMFLPGYKFEQNQTFCYLNEKIHSDLGVHVRSHVQTYANAPPALLN